jgi:hypothetical protein
MSFRITGLSPEPFQHLHVHHAKPGCYAARIDRA